MAFRTILVPIRGDGRGESVLDHACALGRHFNAHIRAVHCRPRPQDLMPFGVAVPTLVKDQINASAKDIADDEVERLKGLFDEYVAKHGIKVCDTRPPLHDELTISWSVADGRQADVIGVQGRLASVVAVAQPDHDSNLGQNTLEAALFNTGRPVLMCPKTPVTSLDNNVAIAWNGSAESSRAVAACGSIIAEAKKVTVLAAEDAENLELSAEDLIVHLKDHEIDATATVVTSKGSSIGESVLKAAKDSGADLLIMGAYGRSRGRSLVMGGVTQWIIDHTDLPVLLVH
ncbi:MAG: universal stress protein [Rhodospirillales bacterium]|nr:universal stress protein [Rhodospirillales bacterium]MBO6787046.1 universal stress protein [Rhodospirillales bacterium]